MSGNINDTTGVIPVIDRIRSQEAEAATKRQAATGSGKATSGAEGTAAAVSVGALARAVITRMSKLQETFKDYDSSKPFSYGESMRRFMDLQSMTGLTAMLIGDHRTTVRGFFNPGNHTPGREKTEEFRQDPSVAYENSRLVQLTEVLTCLKKCPIGSSLEGSTNVLIDDLKTWRDNICTPEFRDNLLKAEGKRNNTDGLEISVKPNSTTCNQYPPEKLAEHKAGFKDIISRPWTLSKRLGVLSSAANAAPGVKAANAELEGSLTNILRSSDSLLQTELGYMKTAN